MFVVGVNQIRKSLYGACIVYAVRQYLFTLSQKRNITLCTLKSATLTVPRPDARSHSIVDVESNRQHVWRYAEPREHGPQERERARSPESNKFGNVAEVCVKEGDIFSRQPMKSSDHEDHMSTVAV